MMRYLSNIPISDLSAVNDDVVDEIVSSVRRLFKGFKFVRPVGYNMKGINITRRNHDGTARSGTMDWAIDISPREARYSLPAYVSYVWDGDVVRVPIVFTDHRGQVRGFSDAAINRWIYAGADLSQSIPATLAQR